MLSWARQCISLMYLWWCDKCVGFEALHLLASMTLLIYYYVFAWAGLQKADGKWGLNRVHDTIKPNHRNRFKGMAQCVWANRKSIRFDSACVHLCSLGRTVYHPVGHCQSAEHKNIMLLWCKTRMHKSTHT